MRKRNYGWKPDVPDFRDLLFAPHAAKIPTSVDLRSGLPACYDQGQLGSCTGNAIAGAVEFELYKQAKKFFMPSRLFIYYNERVIEHTVNSDSGAQIRDGIKAVNQSGVCPETDWGYDISKFAVKPPVKCYTDGKKDIATQYQRLNNANLADLQQCLADGYPFVFGMAVYESFESDAVAKTGVVNMPLKKEKNLGGHAILCVGYDNASGRFLVRNSWGTAWGMQGYFTIPYEYLTNTNLCDDFWTIRQIQ